jgi:hypothetical protein
MEGLGMPTTWQGSFTSTFQGTVINWPKEIMEAGTKRGKIVLRKIITNNVITCYCTLKIKRFLGAYFVSFEQIVKSL